MERRPDEVRTGRRQLDEDLFEADDSEPIVNRETMVPRPMHFEAASVVGCVVRHSDLDQIWSVDIQVEERCAGGMGQRRARMDEGRGPAVPLPCRRCCSVHPDVAVPLLDVAPPLAGVEHSRRQPGGRRLRPVEGTALSSGDASESCVGGSVHQVMMTTPSDTDDAWVDNAQMRVLGPHVGRSTQRMGRESRSARSEPARPRYGREVSQRRRKGKDPA